MTDQPVHVAQLEAVRKVDVENSGGKAIGRNRSRLKAKLKSEALPNRNRGIH